MEINFKGKRAIVTGASKGLGRAIAKKLAQCGATVYGIARNKRELEILKMEQTGIEIVPLDIAADWNMTQTIIKKLLPIDLLVNNAGLAILNPLTKIKEVDIDKLFAINVKALINLTQIVANDLITRKAIGSIVNLSSQASLVGLQDHGVYCASKAAVDGFTRAAALELGLHNIRINCVNPTVILTDMGKQGWADPLKAGPMLDKIPLKRFGEEEDVVNAVLFLLSDKSAMTTGCCFPIDGGFLSV